MRPSALGAERLRRGRGDAPSAWSSSGCRPLLNRFPQPDFVAIEMVMLGGSPASDIQGRRPRREWYLPSRVGTAVRAGPGRSGPRRCRDGVLVLRPDPRRFATVAWWLSVLRWEDGIARWVQPPPHVRNDRRRADGDDHDAQRATRRRAGATAGLSRTWPARAPAAAGNAGGTSADDTPRGQSASGRRQGRCTLPLPHRVARLARCRRAAARVRERGFCDGRKPEIGDEVSGLRA